MKDFLRSFVIGMKQRSRWTAKVASKMSEIKNNRQPPEFNYDVNDTWEKSTVWLMAGIMWWWSAGRTNFISKEMWQIFSMHAGRAFRSLCRAPNGVLRIALLLHLVYQSYLVSELLPLTLTWNRHLALVILHLFLLGYLKCGVYTKPPSEWYEWVTNPHSSGRLMVWETIMRAMFHSLLHQTQQKTMQLGRLHVHVY